MKRFALIAALLLSGCMTTGGSAELTRPDGTSYKVSQRNMAVAGGRAKAAEQQFVASYRLPDGTDVQVKMGNGVEQPASPNTLRDLTSLLQTLAPFLAPSSAAVSDTQPAFELEPEKPP